MNQIRAAMKGGDFSALQANGIKVANEKYQFLRTEEGGSIILGKKKEKGAVTIQKTKTGKNYFNLTCLS